jgi:hypothetical protein
LEIDQLAQFARQLEGNVTNVWLPSIQGKQLAMTSLQMSQRTSARLRQLSEATPAPIGMRVGLEEGDNTSSASSDCSLQVF